jgi:hypothetical protein
MEEDKTVLIAQLLLESSIGAHIEWLVDELNMTANKIEHKDVLLVMLPTDVITHMLDSFSYPWSLFISS